jgi:hypothetical protein
VLLEVSTTVIATCKTKARVFACLRAAYLTPAFSLFTILLGGAGADCQVSYNTASEKYTDVNNKECADGYTCTGYEDDAGADNANKIIYDGICAEETCAGQSDPDNLDDQGTQRVTICHRTCSETNPWVRITIDDDAWGGDGASQCLGGHQREHDVLEDCNLENKDINVWGPPYKDYLIKWHGTRTSVALAHPEWSDNDEKDY